MSGHLRLDVPALVPPPLTRATGERGGAWPHQPGQAPGAAPMGVGLGGQSGWPGASAPGHPGERPPEEPEMAEAEPFDLLVVRVTGPRHDRVLVLDVQLQEGRASDRTASLPGPLPAGALRLADLGYWSLEAFAALAQHEVFWLSRLHMQTAVYDATGARQDLLTLLETQPTETVDLAVALGERQRLAARLLAVRVPQDVADTRRRRLRAAAHDKGRQVSATRLALAAWTLFVTNVPIERLTLREVLGLGRMRWQIALLCKVWKGQGRVDESRSTTPWRILCAVYAKRLAMLVQHGVFLVSFWAYPDRSLTKAAQTVQKHALHRASALTSVQRLGKALLTVKRCLAAGGRMHRRNKPPNTYQLLLEAT